MSQTQEAPKDLVYEASKSGALSAEDRIAITESLLESPVAQSMTEAGLQCQLKRRELRSKYGARRQIAEESAPTPGPAGSDTTGESSKGTTTDVVSGG